MTFDDIRFPLADPTQPCVSPPTDRKRALPQTVLRKLARPKGGGYEISGEVSHTPMNSPSLNQVALSLRESAGDRLRRRLAVRAAAEVSSEDQVSLGHGARVCGGGRRHEDAFGDSPLLFPIRKSVRLQPSFFPFMSPAARDLRYPIEGGGLLD